MGRLCLVQGKADVGARCLEEGMEIAERNQDLVRLRIAQGILAEHELVEGRSGDALARLEAVAGEAPDQELALLLPVLAWAYLETGNVPAAEDVAARALTAANVDFERIEAMRIAGLVAARTGRHAEAATTFDEVLAFTRRFEYPYGVGRVLYTYGVALSAMGDSQQSRERLGQACTVFRRLGARSYLNRTEQTIAQLNPA
jgi:tetratricopeptide (TPR) repeat protein